MRRLLGCAAAAVLGCGSFAAAPDDAGVADGGSAGPQAFRCTGTELFAVETFARDVPEGNGWKAVGSPFPRIDMGDGARAPSLLAAHAADAEGGDDPVSAIERTVKTRNGALCVEVDVRVRADASQYGDRAYTEIISLLPAGSTNVFAEMRSTGLNLAVIGGGHLPFAGFPIEQWVHVVLRFDFAQRVAELSVGDRTVRNDALAGNPFETVDIALGARSAGPTSAVEVRLDNARATTP